MPEEILVVEDDDGIRTTLALALRDEGVVVQIKDKQLQVIERNGRTVDLLPFDKQEFFAVVPSPDRQKLLVRSVNGNAPHIRVFSHHGLSLWGMK